MRRRLCMRHYDAPMRTCALFLVAAVGVIAGCGGGGDKTVSGPPPKAPTTITLRSPAFTNGAEIPKQYTCDGDGISPPLVWSSVPRKAKELALLMEDPDAPGGTFVHWAAWGIPSTVTQIPPGVPTNNLQQGKNSFGKAGYGAPCPPKGDAPHRYLFTLYALSQTLPLGNGASPADVRDAIGKIAIGQGVLTGKYGR
jgi:Raf kinase inhibitor-like YbhB/YbcL family protein